MSDSVEKGFKEAVAGVLAGIILSAVLGIIPTLPIQPLNLGDSGISLGGCLACGLCQAQDL